MRLSSTLSVLSLATTVLVSPPVVHATPLLPISNSDSTIAHIVDKVGDKVSWLCELPLLNRVCQRANRVLTALAPAMADLLNPDIVTLPIGKVQGTKVTSTKSSGSVRRYTLPYAQAPTGELRFKPTASKQPWSNVYNATQLPPACPQSGLISTPVASSEDCLFMNVYVPSSAGSNNKLPVFVWIHGGSLTAGSLNDVGLDGSILAEKGGMIVVTIQYRLGVLGFLRSSALAIDGNMAVWDVIEALKFIQSNIGGFNGLSNSVTIAGQSSGASLIKTLLTVPQASSLFQRAILHSAPLDYGDHPMATSEALGQLFLQIFNTSCTDLACMQMQSVSSFIPAQDYTSQYAPSVLPGISASEPFRPVIDNKLLSSSFFNSMNRGAGFPTTNKDIIFTTVLNEAGPTVAAVSSDTKVEMDEYVAYVDYLIDEGRAEKILASNLYVPDPAVDDSPRQQLELLGTDWVWRCANQQAAVNITAHNNANKVFLAEFDIGIPYISNVGVSFCQRKVCHQDDIEVVFSTGGDSLTPAQQALEQEVLLRWSAFAKNGSPNAWGYTQWDAVSVTNPDTSNEVVELNMLRLTGSSSCIVQEQRREECGRNGFWGRIVPFDAQIYQKRLRR